MKEIIDDQTHSSKHTSKESFITNIYNRFEQKWYNKITQGVKAEFLELVINGNCSIKKVLVLSSRHHKFLISIIVLLKVLCLVLGNNLKKSLKYDVHEMLNFLDTSKLWKDNWMLMF
jgi:hypothetical protein